MSKPRGTIKDALKTDSVKLLETNPDAFVQHTRRQPFGFVQSKSASKSERGTEK